MRLSIALSLLLLLSLACGRPSDEQDSQDTGELVPDEETEETEETEDTDLPEETEDTEDPGESWSFDCPGPGTGMTIDAITVQELSNYYDDSWIEGYPEPIFLMGWVATYEDRLGLTQDYDESYYADNGATDPRLPIVYDGSEDALFPLDIERCPVPLDLYNEVLYIDIYDRDTGGSVYWDFIMELEFVPADWEGTSAVRLERLGTVIDLELRWR